MAYRLRYFVINIPSPWQFPIICYNMYICKNCMHRSKYNFNFLFPTRGMYNVGKTKHKCLLLFWCLKWLQYLHTKRSDTTYNILKYQNTIDPTTRVLVFVSRLPYVKVHKACLNIQGCGEIQNLILHLENASAIKFYLYIKTKKKLWCNFRHSGLSKYFYILVTTLKALPKVLKMKLALL